MTNREYLLCEKINAGEIQDWRALPAEEQGLIRAMAARKWVWLDQAGNVMLEPIGYAALQAHDEALEHEAQQRAEQDAAASAERARLDQETKKQFRHDWRIAVFEVFGGFVLGLIADHFFDVVGYVTRLWSALFQ